MDTLYVTFCEKLIKLSPTSIFLSEVITNTSKQRLMLPTNYYGISKVSM